MEKIICENLTFSYALADKNALNNVSFTVNEGDFFLLIGQSAAGKSTLLKLLKKEISPNGILNGKLEISSSVGYVAQNVDESIVCDKVYSELAFGLSNSGKTADEVELAVAEIASYFNLENKLYCDISSLSGGEKQLVNLAAVMIMKPQILVLDEPTSQLDPISTIRFVEMIKKLHTDFGITVVMSEHSNDLIFDYADKILLLSEGRSQFCAAPIEMIDYLKKENHIMLASVPVQMRLINGAYSVSQCKNALRNFSFKTIDYIEKMPENTVLNAKGLCFAYNKGVDVLSNLDLNIYEGKINAVIGPNSSGKSTLLKCLAGVLKCYRGKIKTQHNISMLCQNPYDLFRFEKCCDEVDFGELTEFLEIDDIKNQHPYDISGGQAQRLALAKVLSTGADIILLDEPTKGFDADLKQKFALILKRLCKMGKTVLLVSHDIEFVGEYADFVSFLSNGKIASGNSRRQFFSQLNFYTTAISKITDGLKKGIVSESDFKEALIIEQ